MNRIYRTGQGGFILFSVLFALRVGALVVEEEIAQTLFKSLIDFFKFIVVLDHCQICFAVLLNDLEGENLVLAFENFFAVVIYGQQRDIASAVCLDAVELFKNVLLAFLVTTPIIKDENTKKFSGNLFSSFLFLLTIARRPIQFIFYVFILPVLRPIVNRKRKDENKLPENFLVFSSLMMGVVTRDLHLVPAKLT